MPGNIASETPGIRNDKKLRRAGQIKEDIAVRVAEQSADKAVNTVRCFSFARQSARASRKVLVHPGKIFVFYDSDTSDGQDIIQPLSRVPVSISKVCHRNDSKADTCRAYPAF